MSPLLELPYHRPESDDIQTRPVTEEEISPIAEVVLLLPYGINDHVDIIGILGVEDVITESTSFCNQSVESIDGTHLQ